MNNENDRAVTTAVISFGQKLNLRVIAEGVETELKRKVNWHSSERITVMKCRVITSVGP